MCFLYKCIYIYLYNFEIFNDKISLSIKELKIDRKEKAKMKLFVQKSERLDKHNKPYDDFFLAWLHEGQPYWVRIEPSFYKDIKFLLASAEKVPAGECIDKYI